LFLPSSSSSFSSSSSSFPVFDTELFLHPLLIIRYDIQYVVFLRYIPQFSTRCSQYTQYKLHIFI
jgi:hypothetical protein